MLHSELQDHASSRNVRSKIGIGQSHDLQEGSRYKRVKIKYFKFHSEITYTFAFYYMCLKSTSLNDVYRIKRTINAF